MPSLLDRLRSTVTGTPAAVYATVREARGDLTRLKTQEGKLLKKLSEQSQYIDQMILPWERFADGDRLLYPLVGSGTINDRKAGKNVPLVWSELDLRNFRWLSRILCETNPLAVGFLSLLTNFHLRKGFGWQVALQGQGPGNFDAGIDPAEVDPDVKACQAVLDEWKRGDPERPHTGWRAVSREAFRRWRRDGEVFLRFFRGGFGTKGLPEKRFVEPEQVGCPPGETDTGPYSFGVLKDPQDNQGPAEAYFVRDPAGDGLSGTEVPGPAIIQLRANVDAAVKRGLPDFFPVQRDLGRVHGLLSNMAEVARVQAAIAWVNQFATATVQQVQALVEQNKDYSRLKLPPSSPGRQTSVVEYEPGTVLNIDAGRTFVPSPTATGTPGFVQAAQACLRGCGVRWNFPEYFSGDASNANYSSTKEAGSPFVAEVEGGQDDWSDFELAVAMKVLRYAAESGRLTPAQVARVTVHVTAPKVVLADPESEDRRRETQKRNGVLSAAEWIRMDGRDPKVTFANLKQEKDQNPDDQGGGGGLGGLFGGGGDDPGPSAPRPGLILDHARHRWVRREAVSWIKEGGFTGRRQDKLGRTRCYSDGKPVPCHTLGGDHAAAGKREAVRQTLADPAKLTAHDVADLDAHLKQVTAMEMKGLQKQFLLKHGRQVKAERVKALLEYARTKGGEPTGQDDGRGSGTGDARGSGPVDGPPPGDGGQVAGAAGGPGDGGGGQGGDAGGQPAGNTVARRVPASTAEVNRRLDRFDRFFRDKGQHHVSDWLGKLRDHVNAVGAESALAAVGGPGEGGAGRPGDAVQYWGVGPEEANWKAMGDFMEAYLDRHGVIAITGDESSPDSPLISALGAPDRYVAGTDFKPGEMPYTNKLDEAKDLPGLGASEDIGVVAGKPVTHLTPDVLAKLDERYGAGKWIVKCYDDNAAAGYGIFFPQRAAAIQADARNTLWTAGEQVGRHGFALDRDESGKVVGLKHSGGDVYPFGSEKYESTIDGDVRQWGDRAANAAAHEGGAMLPEGSFMSQPAFQALGITDEQRAAGQTWHPTNEARVHLVVREGTAEIIPHATWLKGGDLPIVGNFSRVKDENGNYQNIVVSPDDTKAMEKAAQDAINQLPEKARRGQVYAPDVMKTADGYKVVELNAQGDTNGSGYLHDNHFTIDSFVSHLGGRPPAHVAFIRKLLSTRAKP